MGRIEESFKKSIENSGWNHFITNNNKLKDFEHSPWAENKLCKVNPFAIWEKDAWVGKEVLLTGWNVFLYAGKGNGYEVECPDSGTRSFFSIQCLDIIDE